MKWYYICLLLLCSFNTKAQTITTFAGCDTCGSVGDGGPATAAVIYDPNGGVFDKYGNYYYTECLGCRVRKISTSGIITTIAGNGSAGFSGDGGLATEALVNEPTAVILDTFGNLYIADLGNERIRKIDVATGIITTICGNGTGAFYGDSGPASAAEIWGPQDICFDKFGNLYIADAYNYRVRKINTAGIISTFAGTGSISGTGTGDGGPAIAATFGFLSGLASDDTGNIYIADGGNGKVRKVNTAGIITTIAGNGTLTYIGDGIPALNAQIAPLRLGFDSSENLFIADRYNFRVYKVDHAGVLHNVAGDGMTGYSGDGGPAPLASIDYPAGISFDHCGNLYVPDVNNERIRKVIFDSTGIPIISISPSADTVCAGTAVTYTTTVMGSSTFAYKWMVNGSVVSTFGSTYTYTPANGDSVRCIFAGTGQCSGAPDTVGSNTIHMVVKLPTVPSITLSGPTTAVAGGAVTVTATPGSAGSSYSINWYSNGVLFATTTSATVTYTMTTGSDTITATIIPTGGCYDSATAAAHIIAASNTGVINVNAQEVSIYPNPAHSSITIAGSINSITMTNAIGQAVISRQANISKTILDVSALPAGMYMLTITGKNGDRRVSKIVKE